MHAHWSNHTNPTPSQQYTAAAKTGTLDNTGKALENLANVFKRDTRLQTILQAPSLTAEDKSSIIGELQKSMGATDKGAAETLRHFLDTLAENNRLAALEGVCDKFGELMSAHRGEVELTITSAAPLEQRVLRQLEQAVGKSQYVGQGKRLKVVPKVSLAILKIRERRVNADVLVSQVNPDIRGGLIVEIGDRTIDLSVSSKMSKMNKLLQDTL